MLSAYYRAGNQKGSIGQRRILVYADIIYEHRLRKHRRIVRISRPVSANRNIEQQEERVVEDPLAAGGQIGWRSCLEEIAVNKEPHYVRLPLEREYVKVGRKRLTP